MGKIIASANLTVVINFCRQQLKGERVYIGSQLEGKALQLECEADDHIAASVVRKEGRMKAGAQLAFSFVYSLRPQSMGWCHPHSQ